MAGIKNDFKSGKFELRFYSGYKGEEIPRAVVIGNREFKIKRIISRKRVFDSKSGEKSEVFRCKMNDKVVEITLYESGKWAISFPDQS